MTVRECARLILGDETFDAALPENWVDAVIDLVAVDRSLFCSSFVWAYDAAARFNGRPCALTAQANSWLKTINGGHGTNWPLTPGDALARAWPCEEEEAAAETAAFLSACGYCGVPAPCGCQADRENIARIQGR